MDNCKLSSVQSGIATKVASADELSEAKCRSASVAPELHARLNANKGINCVIIYIKIINVSEPTGISRIPRLSGIATEAARLSGICNAAWNIIEFVIQFSAIKRQ